MSLTRATSGLNESCEALLKPFKIEHFEVTSRKAFKVITNESILPKVRKDYPHDLFVSIDGSFFKVPKTAYLFCNINNEGKVERANKYYTRYIKVAKNEAGKYVCFSGDENFYKRFPSSSPCEAHPKFKIYNNIQKDKYNKQVDIPIKNTDEKILFNSISNLENNSQFSVRNSNNEQKNICKNVLSRTEQNLHEGTFFNPSFISSPNNKSLLRHNAENSISNDLIIKVQPPFSSNPNLFFNNELKLQKNTNQESKASNQQSSAEKLKIDFILNKN